MVAMADVLLIAEEVGERYVLTLTVPRTDAWLGLTTKKHRFETIERLCDYLTAHCRSGEVNIPLLRDDLERGIVHSTRVSAECAARMGFDS